MAKKKQIVIRASSLFDGTTYKSNKTVVIEDGVIVDVLSKKLKSDFEGIVTPALIDPHSHIGMFRQGEPMSESEGNDNISLIRPSHDPLNAIYFDDIAFQDAVDFGVLYSCVVPGSANLICGRAKVIRNFARDRSEAEVKDLGYKMALGYNPTVMKDSGKGERPSTRMGVYEMLERSFTDVLRKYEQSELKKEEEMQSISLDKDLSDKQKEASFEIFCEKLACDFSADDWALLDLLSGEPVVKVHVHKEDDVMYLLDLKDRFDLNITAEHLSDVHHERIFRECKKAGVSIVYGPLGCHAYKTELKHSYYQNAALLMKSGAHYGLMTDHPVIHATALIDSTKYFLFAGASDEEVLSLITRRNAEVLGLESHIGSIAPGMHASVLVWDKDPLHLSSLPRVVIGEGSILRK